MTKEYIPKVGEKCEYKLKTDSVWSIATPMYIGSRLIVLRAVNVESACDESRYEIRPLKTQAEIEREEAIAIVCDALVLKESELIPNIKSAVLVILNEGYRKQGEVVGIEQVEKNWLESSEMVWIYFLDDNYIITKKAG